MIAAVRSSLGTMSLLAINRSSTATEGKRGGSFSPAYSGDVLLMMICALESSSRPAVSAFDDHRFTMGSLRKNIIMLDLPF
jgi:hypothetical protein